MRIKRAGLSTPSGGVEMDLGSLVGKAEAIGHRRANEGSWPIRRWDEERPLRRCSCTVGLDPERTSG